MNARIGWQNLRTSEFLDNGDYMLITGTDFKDGEIDYSNIHYVKKNRFDQDKKIQISNGSILITKDGTLGKVAYVTDLPMPATLNAGVFNVRIKNENEVNDKYLFHYLKAPFLLKFSSEQSTGGTIKHLNQNVLVKFPVPLPALAEQNKIAEFLTNFDKLITLQQRQLDLYKKLKKGLLQKLFPKDGEKVPEVRFADFHEDWKQFKLNELRDFNDKYSFTGGPFGSDLKSSDYTSDGIRIIQLQNIGDGFFLNNYKIYTSKEKAQSLSSNYIYPGEIIIAKMASPLARATIIPKLTDIFLMSSDGIRLKIDSKKYDNYFVLTAINNSSFRKKALANSSGTTRKRIGLAVLGNLILNIPKFQEQVKVGGTFKRIDRQITLQYEKLNKLNFFKKYLLQKLFI